MYDIKLGQGCGIKATMLTPAGGVCDLRRARYIAASLVLVSGATMNCEDVTFNEVTNATKIVTFIICRRNNTLLIGITG